MNVLGRGVPVVAWARLRAFFAAALSTPLLGLRLKNWGAKPMSLTIETDRAANAAPPLAASPARRASPAARSSNGAVTPFDSAKIAVALTKAFLAVEGTSAAASRRVHDTVDALTEQIVGALTRRSDAGRTFHIEDIQDQVELSLMRGEHHKVARAYVLYREARAHERALAKASALPPPRRRCR